MNRLTGAIALAVTWTFTVGGLATDSADALDASEPNGQTPRVAPKPSLSAPASVIEGDRYKITAKVPHLRNAKRIDFQQFLPEYLGDSTPVWTTVRSRRVVNGRSLILIMVADESATQRTRAVITYASGARSTSRPANVKIWHWTNLYDFDAYYAAGYVSDSQFASFAMNGDTWLGWQAYFNSGMWESRYTLGRHCKAFRGTLGVADDSSDGTTATVTLLTDETKEIYTSPALVPGAVEQVELNLSRPYRFSIQARDTTQDSETTYVVHPAIGTPQFLCHFD